MTPLMLATRIATERLVLRPYGPDDVHDYAAMQTDPEVVRFLSWPLRTAEESAQHFQRRLRQDMLRREGDFMALAVWSPEHERVIGDVSMHLRSEDLLVVEVGWILSTEFRGHGYALEAASALVGYARRHGAQDVYATIHPENLSSIRLAERLGVRIMLTGESRA